tara:strand:- start:470 stop:943 length:474 start_codon:yes stop_codon:yes gene_type:complete
MAYSYNTLVDIFETFGENHLIIKRQEVSFFEQINNFSTDGDDFPLMYVEPSSIEFDVNVDNYSFRVYIVDLLLKDRSNEKEVMNQTQMVMRDLINWVRLSSDLNINITNIPLAIPVNNFLLDFTVGWYVDIDIESTTINNDCSIPFKDGFDYKPKDC